ncbi:Nucleoside-diphosphate-sugar epimerase [Minicystis rosea]|nr:Nucleoside-diphosphate-sugar epimerase [Minicystis rosea]
MASTEPRRALVVGSTGIVGRALSARLVDQRWKTFGLSRSGRGGTPGVTDVAADLLDPAGLSRALAGTRPALVAISAWMRRSTEAENIEVNSALVRNVLAALEPERSIEHVALITGLKHYLGPFESYAAGVMPDTPFHEDAPRLSAPNFYYAQEDEVFTAAAKNGFRWSVHRPHSIFGFAVGNAMNMALTLSVYATLCKESGAPFIFPGSAMQWNGLTDVTDADLLADHIVWAATHPEGRNQAFNVVDGDVFRWRWMWPRIAEIFGIAWEGFAGAPRPLAARMGDASTAWRAVAAKHALVEPDITRLASWWHTDGDLGRNIECVTDMTKSRKAGFLTYRSSLDSFTEKVNRYRAARIIP